MSPLIRPPEPQLQPCAPYSCDEESKLLCMELHVFVFCIIISALASGLVVASRGLLDKLKVVLRRTVSVHNPRLKHVNAAGPNLVGSEPERKLVQAAEATDRAAAAPLEAKGMLPSRYVRAFCGKEKHAKERWKATLAWREENEIDAILNEPQPYFHDIRRYFPSYMSGRSRGGHIVVYEKLGEVDMPTLRRLGVSVPMLLRHWIFVSEYMYRVLQPTDSAQQVTVEDMKGVSIQSLAGKIQEYVKGAAHLARLYYVERCHKTYVVNAPAWFGLAFRIVSPFLSARTRQKIRILGTDLSPLHDEIDPQNLPVEYGGTNPVPVYDSPEERHLRRLVDAINTNADKNADVHKRSNADKDAATKCGFSTPSKTGTRHSKDSSSGRRRHEVVQRGDDADRSSPEQGLVHIMPGSRSEPRRRAPAGHKRRIRARTYEDTSALLALQTRGPTFVRRATWGGTETHSEYETFTDWTSTSALTLEMPQGRHSELAVSTGNNVDGGRAPPRVGVDRTSRLRSSRFASERRDTNRVLEGTFVGENDRIDVEGLENFRCPDDGNKAEDEIRVDDRLQQAMKDLDVSSGDHGRDGRYQHALRPSRDRQLGYQRVAQLSGGAVGSAGTVGADSQGGRSGAGPSNARDGRRPGHAWPGPRSL